ncbi:DUF2637 domain-containing protein (plasmid) [Streptomyces sp. NBC_01023]|uniref:DUF2637 domain-containing protein n=1 Tax=unclassified Streptomyces TaxID=2593676 RepID=UPI002F9189A9|nr:DUF2637 domain-containing protein [Streptomyces sp. NBC_01023]
MAAGTRIQLSRTHRILIALVVAGAVIIAGIGFVGSYAAVRELAQEKGFGAFSTVFPIGIDAGICVLLALDLLLTWIRIPFPLLRQTAWLLTAATIAFNGAAAWPDPLGTGMHAVIPMLFVVCVEAARHAVGRIADITADKHMEGVRLTRWLLAPVPTFLLWRRMKLWELRRYDEVIKLEQDRLIYQARLQARFGRAWRRKAPIESLMPLRLARYGVPLAETAPSGLAAAGIGEPGAPAEHLGFDPAELAHAALTERPLEPAPPIEQNRQAASPGDEPPTGGVAFEPGGFDFDYSSEFRQYVAAYDTVPTDRQFALYLRDFHGVVDPQTGDVIPEQRIGPHLEELRDTFQETFPEFYLPDELRASSPWFEPRPDQPAEFETDAGLPTADVPAEPHADPELDPDAPGQPPQAEPSTREPVLAPTGSAVPDQRDGGGVPQQLSIGASFQRSAPSQPDTESAAPWVAAVTDTGEATARAAEPEHQEPELDAEEQRIRMVAGWLAEAEESNRKLSGAEVARRLDVSPRTGQRALGAAKKYREEQLRQHGRAHLRSVADR